MSLEGRYKEKNVNFSNCSRVLSTLLFAIAILFRPGVASAQATIHVPQDFPTIQAAIDAAHAGDTILVAEGRWCGAIVRKTVNLIGIDDDSTIIACPSNFGPANAKRGLLIQTAASGSAVRHFAFDGAGFSDANRTPIAIGIGSNSNANNITVEHNRFVGGLLGININGTGWNVSDNVFEDFTLLNPPDCTGGAAIVSGSLGPALFSHTFKHNKIRSTVPAGTSPVCSWINEVDVPVAGIVVAGQDGTTIGQNKVSIGSNLHGDSGAGIIVSDQLNPAADFAVSVNVVITDNDARGSAFGVIVTTGNTQGAVIRDNKGNNLINGLSASRVSHSMKDCDDTQSCQ
jgi:hypothetical protein